MSRDQNQNNDQSVTSDTLFTVSVLILWLTGSAGWSRWKGVELRKKTLCTERVTHPLCGAFTVRQINACGNRYTYIHASKGHCFLKMTTVIFNRRNEQWSRASVNIEWKSVVEKLLPPTSSWKYQIKKKWVFVCMSNQNSCSHTLWISQMNQ